MMEEYRTAFVYVRNIFAGILKETDEGYSFEYDDKYIKRKDASAVSLTLPIKEEPYKSKTIFVFF